MPVEGYMEEAPPEFLYVGVSGKILPDFLTSTNFDGYSDAVCIGVTRQAALNKFDVYDNVNVFKLKAGEMSRAGFIFSVSSDGLWVSDELPLKYVKG